MTHHARGGPRTPAYGSRNEQVPRTEPDRRSNQEHRPPNRPQGGTGGPRQPGTGQGQRPPRDQRSRQGQQPQQSRRGQRPRRSRQSGQGQRPRQGQQSQRSQRPPSGRGDGTDQGLQYGGEARHGQSPSHVGTRQEFGRPTAGERGDQLRRPQPEPRDVNYPQSAYPQVSGSREERARRPVGRQSQQAGQRQDRSRWSDWRGLRGEEPRTRDRRDRVRRR